LGEDEFERQRHAHDFEQASSVYQQGLLCPCEPIKFYQATHVMPDSPVSNRAEDNIRRRLVQSSVDGAADLPSFQPISPGADLLVFFFSRH
jgi:hypothetical protein